MSATVQINDETSFVYRDGSLVPVSEAEKIEEDGRNERRFFPRHLGEDETWKLVPDFIMEEDLPIFQSVVSYTLECVKDYLTVLAEETKANTYAQSKKYTYTDLIKEIDKSALLERIIRGHKPLPQAPPKSYSQPWYDLVDRGEDICIDVWFRNPTGFSKRSPGNNSDYKEVSIDSETWKIEESLGPMEYVVYWPENLEDKYILSPLTDEEFDRLLHPRLRNRMTEHSYSWKLTRMEKDDAS